ncbi:endoglucanase-like isoform X3 [Anthonomus grandis grandis]|uniref:endoglucanase-like isoform X3 n=1 Tax=Anthonomus grandis grandis TaxID=2921223 RepID=UPI0021655C79|nr:endoglucanase-like isoform X3 [Anthonomus grandis grandis]
MKSFVGTIAVLSVVAVAYGLSGSGTTTRYWDCCKPSCSWKENVGTLDPVESCAADGETKLNASVHSGCDWDGTSYVCNNLQPWAVNDTFAYGFVAASFTGGVDNSKCCICLKLTFKNALAGKTFVVQNVNTGGDLGSNQFDIQIPGGGVGIFTRGCQTQWNAPSSGWGQQYGGVTSDAECDELPTELQAGCHFRFGWYENADNPQVDFEQITCPTELTSLTGCVNDNMY